LTADATAQIGIREVEGAARRLAGVAVKTPLIRSPELDEIARGSVWLKAESLQLTGSFKIRGAYNMMSRLSAEEAAAGVVAWSSGNHAQGVAAAGAMLGIETIIVMPQDTPRVKLEGTKRLGGKPVLYDRYAEDREVIGRRLAAERGARVVPSYDNPDIVAGQGTVGLEIMRQARAAARLPDQVLFPCGGGGLIAGSAVAIKAIAPETAVHPVEPAGFDDTARSLRAGERLANDPAARSICDALLATLPGELTFQINRYLLSDGLVVSDEEVRAAMRFAFRYLKLVVEPGGAVALAAVLAQKIPTEGKATVVVLSGGNVDSQLFASIQKEG
jgi:threonine dehydratase